MEITQCDTACQHCAGQGYYNQAHASRVHAEHLFYGSTFMGCAKQAGDIECPVCNGTGKAGGAQ